MSGLIVANVTGSGATAAGKPGSLAMGSDGTNVYPLKTDNTGALQVSTISAGHSTAGSLATVALLVTSLTAIPANTNRKGAGILNTSSVSMRVNIAGGDAAAVYHYVVVQNATWECPFNVTNAITVALASAGTGNAFPYEAV